jgi:hypothetical protein
MQMTSSAVGAYGERIVEAELLRRGWIPANVNASIRNNAEHDIYAKRGKEMMLISVKACGIGKRAFPLSVGGVAEPTPSDFTILVRMGACRAQDEFYVVPTSVVRQEVRARREYALQVRQQQDSNFWRLDLGGPDGQPGCNLASRWREYRDNWEFLPAGITNSN